MAEKSDELWRMAIGSSKFSPLTFPLSIFPTKATINLSKFYLSKFRERTIHQILSHFSTVKVFCYAVIYRSVHKIAQNFGSDKIFYNKNLVANLR